MKIYNEVVSRFNEITQKWETISEDSFEYNGEMALAQGIPPNASPINTSDTIADTIKTTAGYFSNGDGTLSGNDVHSGSLSATNEKYYFNVLNGHPLSSSSEVQFSVTYGHFEGSGSDTIGDSSTNPNTLKGETRAIYKQLTNVLLEETEASGGFKIASNGSNLDTDEGATGLAVSAGARDDFVYALIGKRARFKDRLNKKSWTLTLSGSKNDGAGRKLHLTDDSLNTPAVATPGGPRFNIVSGTLGSVHTAASTKTFGFYYPEMGIMLFSGTQLSASMPGPAGCEVVNARYVHTPVGTGAPLSSSLGFAPNVSQNSNGNNALRLLNCMRTMGASTSLRLRSEEDQTQENYFCRIRAEEYNFSANPTFVSGSKNKIRAADMHGNPQTFITGVGLYNSSGQLLAVAKLSSPLKKNFASEATIKVKLTY